MTEDRADALISAFCAVVAVAILLGILFFSVGCASAPRVYRVRMHAIKTDILAYESAEQASRQCRKHIQRWENKTGRVHVLDNGEPAKMGQEYRGCKVPPIPAKPPLEGEHYQRIITSIETIDNLCHELCHALKAPDRICEQIHFDGRYYPGRTINVEDPK